MLAIVLSIPFLSPFIATIIPCIVKTIQSFHFVVKLFLLVLERGENIKTIYDYFIDFTKIETSLFRIEREVMKKKDFLVFRIFKKRKGEEEWQYLGATYILPECLKQVVDKNTLFYANPQNGFLLKIHDTPTLTFYSRFIQILLINYLKQKVRETTHADNLYLKKHK